MKKKLFCFIICATSLCACSNDPALEYESARTQTTEQIDSFLYIEDISELFDIDDNSIQTRVPKVAYKNEDDRGDIETFTVYGCTYNVTKRRRVSMSKNAASQFGLPQGLYIVEYLLCTKDIQTGGRMFVDEESEECGYKTLKSQSDGSFPRGYTSSPNGNLTKMSTYVLRVPSSSSGQSYGDRYLPCIPNNLKWVYSLLAI